jgi:hypothetical protein
MFMCMIGYETVGEPAHDYLICSVAIFVLSVFMAMEQVPAHVSIGFVLSVFAWYQIQPATLNRCHLAAWILVISSMRNCFLVKEHATMSWGFSTIGDMLGATVY